MIEGLFESILFENSANPEIIAKAVKALEGYEYMFIGGVAVSAQTNGKRRVSENDVDIAVMIDSKSVDDLKKALETTGLTLTRQHRFGGGEWLVYNYGSQGIDVRLVSQHDEYFDASITVADRLSFKGSIVKVMSKPYLLVNKISAGREKDMRDILYILKNCDDADVSRAMKLIKIYEPRRQDEFKELMNDRELPYEMIDSLYPS